MDQTSAPTQTETTLAAETAVPTPPRLFNDVHFQRQEPAPAPNNAEWTLFPRFPEELRRLVWLAQLQRYRMIDLEICEAADEGGDTTRPADRSHSRYYTDRNTLGNLVSGRGYVLSWRGRGSRAEAYSPLLWVNQEARRIALDFYRVKLPFSGLRKEQVLFLNPEFDVISIDPRRTQGARLTRLDALTLLADLLHDAKACDSKNQGCVCEKMCILTLLILHLSNSIAHLALRWEYQLVFSSPNWATFVQSIPAALHPIAAASFTGILQHGLRSVLFLVPFRDRHRGQGVPFWKNDSEWQTDVPSDGDHWHFAQTLPLARRDRPACSFDWLEADPRPGVEVDGRNLTLGYDPRRLAHGWKQLEQAFGITRPIDTQRRQQHEPHAATNKAVAYGPRFYVCPSILWPEYEREEVRRQIREPPPHLMPFRAFPAPQLLEGEDEEADQPRSELKRHLREEDERWQKDRSAFHEAIRVNSPDARMVPKQGSLMDAEAFERMERLPCTAIGLWLFPAEAFGEPTDVKQVVFDMSAVKPGLFLFDV